MSQAAAMPSLPESSPSSPATTPHAHSQQQLSAKKLLGRLDELVSLAGAFRTATVASAPGLRSPIAAPLPKSSGRDSFKAFSSKASHQMEDRVRHALSANHLDAHTAALGAMGVETALDLSNPYTVSDAQLRSAGMSVLSIRRYRRVGEEMALLLEAEGVLQAVAEEGDEEYMLLTEEERQSRASEWRLARSVSRGASWAREGNHSPSSSSGVVGDGDAGSGNNHGARNSGGSTGRNSGAIGGLASSRTSRESRGTSRSRARESRASGATLAAEAARQAAASFLPLLADLGLEAHQDALLGATGGDKTTRALLIKVPEPAMSKLGVPLVKARKLVDRLRSVEADSLGPATSNLLARLVARNDSSQNGGGGNGGGERSNGSSSSPSQQPPSSLLLTEESEVRSPTGRRGSQVDLKVVLEELAIGHLEDVIVAAAGGRDLADLVRCTEVELVERAGVTTVQAQDLRRLACQHHSALTSESRRRGGSGSGSGGGSHSSGSGGAPQRVVGFRETPAFAPWLRSGSADQVLELQPYSNNGDGDDHGGAEPQPESPPSVLQSTEEETVAPMKKQGSPSNKVSSPPPEAPPPSQTTTKSTSVVSNVTGKAALVGPAGAPPELLPFPGAPQSMTSDGVAAPVPKDSSTSLSTTKLPPTTSSSISLISSKPSSFSSASKPTSPRKLTPVPRTKKHSLSAAPSSPPQSPTSPRSSPTGSSKSFFASGTLRGAKAGRAATFNEATDMVSSVQ